MNQLMNFVAQLLGDIADWRSLRLADLRFRQADTAHLILIILIGLSVATVLARSIVKRKPGRQQVALPALLPWMRISWLSSVRHGPLLLFLAGLPLFAAALADPRTALTRQDVSFPGRRIAVLIDASASMMTPFPTGPVVANANSHSDATFMVAVSAAQKFVHRRISGKYRDLIALIEFGNEAYVVTPFTTDYENILLSMSLIGDWTEYIKFPDTGTTIGLAVDQGIDLFKAFDFLDASGNAMVIISDGIDEQIHIRGKTVADIFAVAVKRKIPVYFLCISPPGARRNDVPERMWKPEIEKTGGKFYDANDDAAILAVIREIDRHSAGRIDVRQYTSEQARFAAFAAPAAALWMLALLLKLTLPFFSKFP